MLPLIVLPLKTSATFVHFYALVRLVARVCLCQHGMQNDANLCITLLGWAPQAPDARGDEILRLQSQEPCYKTCSVINWEEFGRNFGGSFCTVNEARK